MATRLEMESEVRADLSTHAHDAVASNPFALRRAVWRAVDEVAEKTDCLHRGLLLNLVSNQARYCPPGLRRITSVSVKSVSGQWLSGVPVYSVAQMDRRDSIWRNAAASDNLSAIIATGPNSIVLNPPPKTAITGGLRFEGFWKPGEKWAQDATTGEFQPAADGDECPLPAFAETAAIERGKYLLCQTLSTKLPELRSLLPELNARSLELIGYVESDAANHWQAVKGSQVSLWPY